MYKLKKGKKESMSTTIVKFDWIGFVTGKEVESQETGVPSDRFFIYMLYPHLHPIFYLNIFLFPMLTVQLKLQNHSAQVIW